MSWSNSQRNCYQRVLSGMIRSKIEGKSCKFLTLTTSPPVVDGLSDSDKLDLIQYNFKMLHQRIVLEFGDFPYLSVRCFTKDGLPHIHVIYRGDDIPHGWLSDNWNEINGSFIVDIRRVYDNPRKASRYIVSQYLGGQSDLRYGYSHDWIHKGAYKSWSALKDACRDWSKAYPNPYRFGHWIAPIDYDLLYDRWYDYLGGLNG